MHNTRVTIKGWPEELAHMLAEYPPEVMPELYFEYLILLDASYYMGKNWIETDPFKYGLIKEIERNGNVMSIWGFDKND